MKPKNKQGKPLRSRTEFELNQVILKRSPLWARGILDAASIASAMYNSVSNHTHDLGDCILGKLNMLHPKCKIRQNPYHKIKK